MSKDDILTLVLIPLSTIVIIILWVLASKRRERKNGEQFDERQTIARSKAAQASFFSMLAYYWCYLLTIWFEVEWCDYDFGIMLGIMLGTAVFALCAIWNDAFFAIDESGKGRYILFSILALVFAGDSFVVIYRNRVISEGKLTGFAMNIVVTIIYVSMLLTLVLRKWLRRRKESAAE